MSEQEQPLCDSANLFYFNAFHNTFVHYIPVKATFIFIVFDLSRPQICLDSQVIGRHPKGIIDNYFNYDTEYLTKLNLSRELFYKHQSSDHRYSYEFKMCVRRDDLDPRNSFNKIKYKSSHLRPWNDSAGIS